VGIDIGGTFTDLILAEAISGRLHRHKRLTTPEQPAEGALAGLDELLAAHGVRYDRLDHLLHGTTLVTNAIIERRGSRTALLTTRGFRDILEMGNEQRYDIYDLFLRFPEPLVPRRRRLEVAERIDRDGAVLLAPDLDAVEAQVAPLVAAGVEAIAVCFLHSYRNPEHERSVAERIRHAFPQLTVSVSSELIPEVREFERTATTVANAYVQPRMDRYLGRFEAGLAERGFRGRFYLMQSSGGLATPDAARSFPIRFLESGPAGGALISAYLGRAMATPDLLSFDMGGTTAKACLIRGTPVVDMIEIGAGGGSIARVDELGLLKVGPASAGADPGPACYGLGGTAPTVSDACLQLGYFDPDAFLGGRMTLLPEAAERALTPLGAELDLDPTATAWGIYRVVCENMAQAARVHIIERSHDPRRFAVMAFGGAGPAHAARVARILGAPEVIVPQHSGVAAALGFLVAAASFEFSRSYPAEVTDLDWEEVDRLYLDLEARARAILTEAGVEERAMVVERLADMRFVGQFHEIEVPIPAGSLTDGAAERVTAAFAREYERRYHTVLPGYRPMVLNWRLRAHGPEAELPLGPGSGLGADVVAPASAAEPRGLRPAYFPETGITEVMVFDRRKLPVGSVVEGPAIVEEAESTTVVNPGDRLTVDALGNLRIRVAS
jgi:5-oxoprolinase (ATP-hydrolysing)/N-methylhydantoinase A